MKNENKKTTGSEIAIAGVGLTTLGTVAAVAAGGYLLWINRFRVQRLLESAGINTPWMTGDLEEAVKSGGAKIAGTIDHAVKSVTPAHVNKETAKLSM